MPRGDNRTMPAHEIPTHLHGADRVVAGCTWSQLFTLGGGAAVAFWVWQTLALPQAACLGLCAVPVLAALACAFWRPDGHGLLTWLGLATTYAMTPHGIVWSREAANLLLLSAPAIGVRVTTGGVADRLAAGHDTDQPSTVSARVRWPVVLAPRHSMAPRSPVATTRTPCVTHPVQQARVAQVRESPWTPLLGYRLLCLSTHYMDPTTGEHHT
jgi:hypothetical protein